LLSGDAGGSFGVEPEVGMWRRLGVVDINEHRLGVVRSGVKSEMLRAYVVIKEPWLVAVFSGAGVHILHVGLLGRAVIARVQVPDVATPRRLIFSPGKARDEQSRPPVCDQCSGESLS
jgi:hypothetical protein